ncbi:MAG: CRISPR-associated endonuclease Cas3'' [Desulfobulbaceae bacterium]|nr:CRISPR-associated endonuclease Cas3'' [Desulfobulbaceae bacterium]
MKYYAHSLEGQPPENWQPLEEHLKNVAEMAAEFAKPFGGDQWACLAGLWHDLGKYSPAFQKKLYDANGFECHIETQPGRVIHSEAGGHLAAQKGWKGVDRVFSWLIMGHHAGLTDYESEHVGPKALEPKMREPFRSATVLENVPGSILDQSPPNQKFPQGADPSLFIRMLFSCVVDADFLDTEAFMNKRKSSQRNQAYPELAELLPHFDAYMDKLCAGVEPSPINKIRAVVLSQCREAAVREPGVYSLSVPTGGGKTLASLAFALRHAVEHKIRRGKSRIIYVIPFNSIIEQTADVFRKIPGFENAVVEHHSNLAETDEDSETVRNRLAAENWDAPLIVTTSVQFLESLYACRTSRCRKLHNIANSVVIFDEAQCLPPEYLRPSVHVIRELYRHYHVTPVLCTATQPVLTQTESFDFKFREGFEEVTEIVSNPDELAGKLKRVEVVLHRNDLVPVDLPELAATLQSEEGAVLCIVNRRDDARRLAQLLPSAHTVHLSTNMCAAHRTHTLAGIRKSLLRKDYPFFVISTSLVEAGVDIDFPVVYRALTGIDSIAQAAGRCNREDKLIMNGKKVYGKTVVFVPTNQPQYVRQQAGIARELLQGGNLDNLLSPENYEKYFRQRFWQLGEDALDKKRIMELLSGRMNYYFRTAAQRFRLIEDDWQESVLVPYGEAVKLLGRLTSESWHERALLRQMGRFIVGIPKSLFAALAARDYIRESGYPGLFMLDPVLYDESFGFVPPDEAAAIDPEKFMMTE